MGKKIGIGPLETEVFSVLSKMKKGSVKDIHQALGGNLAITTIATVLDRLYKKNLVERQISNTGSVHYIYQIPPINQTNTNQINKILDNFATAFKEPLLSYFISTVGSLDDEERTKIMSEIEKFIQTRQNKGNVEEHHDV